MVWVQALVTCKTELLPDKCTEPLLCSPCPKLALVEKKLLKAYPRGFFQHDSLKHLLHLIIPPAHAACSQARCEAKASDLSKLAPAQSGVDCIRIRGDRCLTSPLSFHQATPVPCQGGAQYMGLVTSPFPSSSHSQQAHKSADAASQKRAISSNSSGAVIIS